MSSKAVGDRAVQHALQQKKAKQKKLRLSQSACAGPLFHAMLHGCVGAAMCAETAARSIAFTAVIIFILFFVLFAARIIDLALTLKI